MGILSVDLAQKFIEKTVKNLNFNINVMNDKGVIIASKDESRVGDFHEVAFNLLNGKMMDGVIKKEDEEKFINTKAGVNMFIDYENEHAGVICVTGDPEEVEEMVHYKEAISAYFQDLYSFLPEGITNEFIGVFVGTLQKSMNKYRSSYANAKDREFLNELAYYFKNIDS